MKIASILPYKENYSKQGAGAVALWISEFIRDSIYKNKTYIIGNTSNKKYLNSSKVLYFSKSTIINLELLLKY